jgi:hypothetical protein
VRVSSVALVTVLAAAIAGAAAALWPLLEQRLPEPTRLTLGGWVPPRDEPLASWLSHRAALAAQGQVLVHADGEVWLTSRADLGLRLETSTARTALERPRAPSSLLLRLRAALGGPTPAPIDLPLRFELDSSRAAAWLAALAPRLKRAPIDARLDLDGHERIEAEAGRELDWGTSLARLSVLGDGDELHLAFRSLPARVPTSALAEVDPSRAPRATSTAPCSRPAKSGASTAVSGRARSSVASSTLR